MPSQRTMEQCLTWLNSKAADENTLDGINAELCLNVISELRERYNKLGAQYNLLQKKINDLYSSFAKDLAR